MASNPAYQFRPATDAAFVSDTLFQSLQNGDFAGILAQRNIRLLLGECSEEHVLYGMWSQPKDNSLAALRTRLLADYSMHIVDSLACLYYPDNKLPSDCAYWHSDAFGRIYADMQVHTVQRGLINALVSGGAGHLIYRYRVEWRLKCVDDHFPPEWGVTHATDQAIWFWGNGGLVSEEEKRVINTAFIEPLAKFVQGPEVSSEMSWGTRNHRQVRRLKPDGQIDIWKDEQWDDAITVWNTLQNDI